jgi:acetoin utilization deacetylase AcuC-like enzyme
LIKQLERIKFGLSIINDNRTDEKIISNSISMKNPSTIIAIQDPFLLRELKKTDLLSYCYTIKLRSASIDELVGLHSSDYVNMIVSAERSHVDISDHRFHIEYNQTAFSNARFSAGTTIDIIENVLNNHHINGFILSISPGHQAFPDHGNGTSIYNNLALAINSLLMDKTVSNKGENSLALFDSNNHVHIDGASPIENAICHMIHVLTPINDDRFTSQHSLIMNTNNNNNNNKSQLQRVLIVDLTCEHGSGLQSIYYESDQVFYISIHKENHAHRSSYHECGKNRGLGYTMNIPLASIDQINDQDYMNIITELILPITKEYQPELILVCVDFHIQNLTTLCYAWIIEQLNMIPNSKLVVALDGNLSNISSKTSYVHTVLSVLIGKLSLINNDEWKMSTINMDIRQKIDLIKAKHKQYWSCFQ